MTLETGRRAVSMSVREFAEFQNGAPPARRFQGHASWRARVGLDEHRALRTDKAFAGIASAFEVHIDGTLVCNGWQFQLTGRIDALTHANGLTRVIEFKTVSARLPLTPDVLNQRYGAYIAQLATYLHLWQLKHPDDPSPQGQLILHHPEDGFRQTVPLNAAQAQELVGERTRAFIPWLEDLRQRKQHLEQWEALHPFPYLREGQAEALARIEAALQRQTCVLFQAPTGFGKTGIALHAALRHLKQGQVERVLFLTGKNSGQLQAIRHFEAVHKATRTAKPNACPPRVFQLRNRLDHGKHCTVTACDQRESCQRAPGLPYRTLPESGVIRLEEIRLLCEPGPSCPLSASQMLMPWCETWVMDYNYVFSPSAAATLESVYGYRPEDTLLIIDEAHNLPSRACELMSFSEDGSRLQALLFDLENAGSSYKTIKAVDYYWAFVSQLRVTDRCSLSVENELKDHLESLTHLLGEMPAETGEFATDSVNQIQELFRQNHLVNERVMEKLLWVSAPGVLRLNALDSGPWIRERLGRFKRCLLMSATLEPFESTLNRMGFGTPSGTTRAKTDAQELCKHTGVETVVAKASWRASAYDVAIDCRIDTRAKARNDFYQKTAATLISLAAHDKTVVFFPSYAYAEAVSAYVQVSAPGLRIALQPRSGSFEEQQEFLHDALISAALIFLILGSSFSESIDDLGGSIHQAVVVSPGLPEVNAVQKALMQTLPDREAAFGRVYLEPGLLKVNQALGRLVRAPGQQARVLLHCKRFAEESTQNFLSEEYRSAQKISSDEDFHRWLHRV